MNLSRSSKCVTTIAALAMAATGALILSQSNADAATIATVHSGVTARLYTANGSLVNNRALGANTPWLIGKTANINGETMYQVSTNEYLRAEDSTISGDKAQPQTNKIIGRANSELKLYNRRTGSMANRDLAKGSSWQIGKSFINKDGQIFVQVSTDEYADANQMSFNQEFNPEQMDDFGVGNTFAGSSTDTNTNSNTDTTAPSTGTDTNTSTPSKTTIDIASVKSAVIASINAERSAKGLTTLINDANLQKMSDIRINDLENGGDGHIRPDGNKWYELYSQLGITYLDGGENIANEFADGSDGSTAQEIAATIMREFKSETYTPNHYDNLIKSGTTKVGVSVMYNSTNNAFQIVEDFA